MALFGDFEVRGDQLIAKETGVAIPITPGFFLDVVRGASFVGFVQALKAARAARARLGVRQETPRARVAFYPKKPRSYYAIWPVCQLADVRIVDDPSEADVLFYFEDREFLTGPHPRPAGAPLDAPGFNEASMTFARAGSPAPSKRRSVTP